MGGAPPRSLPPPAIVQRQPDRGLARSGPGDAMATVGGDGEVIAGAQGAGLGLALEQHAGLALEQEHPLVARLVVPLAGRRGLPEGDDPFQAQVGSVEQGLDGLPGRIGGQVGEEVVDGHRWLGRRYRQATLPARPRWRVARPSPRTGIPSGCSG